MRVRRVGAVAGLLVLLLMTVAAPALAGEEGSDTAKSLGVPLTVLILVGIPLAVYVLIALLVYAPSRLRRPRYRPGVREWGYAPIWIGGPESAQTALTRTPPDVVADVRGGGAGA